MPIKEVKKKVKIPFSILPPKVLEKRALVFSGLGEKLNTLFPNLEVNIVKADLDIEAREYISMCIVSSLASLILLMSIMTFGLLALEVNLFYLFGPLIGIIITVFTFFIQLNYPKILATRKIRDIERNLLSALRNILIQMNSGVPMFNILVSISAGRYGEISNEFSKAIRKINAGIAEITALEEISEKNPSLYFRRALGQIVNGMRSGADISIILQEVIDSLSEEQLVQIQTYGSQLNPLAMFYMLLVVILPSLSVTFIIAISSFTSFDENGTKLLFGAVFVGVLIFQIMFLGIIKTKRPSLLGE